MTKTSPSKSLKLGAAFFAVLFLGLITTSTQAHCGHNHGSRGRGVSVSVNRGFSGYPGGYYGGGGYGGGYYGGGGYPGGYYGYGRTITVNRTFRPVYTNVGNFGGGFYPAQFGPGCGGGGFVPHYRGYW